VSSPADDTLLAECAKALVDSLGYHDATAEEVARRVLAVARPRIEAEAYTEAIRTAEEGYSCHPSDAASNAEIDRIVTRLTNLIRAKESSRATGK
jgi:hypothetical protein